MRNKNKLLPMLALAAIAVFGSALHAQRPRISVGIGIGAPPPAVVYVPASPGPDYYWVQPYWDGHVWVRGYWAPSAHGRVYFGHGRHWDHERAEHRGHWRH
jgi:hypothetical protein